MLYTAAKHGFRPSSMERFNDWFRKGKTRMLFGNTPGDSSKYSGDDKVTAFYDLKKYFVRGSGGGAG
jgi:hypothetical protein